MTALQGRTNRKMTEPGTPPKGLRFPRSVLAAIISAVFVIASFPNPLVPRGLGFFAWMALVPALACLAGPVESGILATVAAGAAYGTVVALGSQYWLASYGLPALVLAALLSALQFSLLFPLVSLSLRKLRFAGPAAAAAIWTLFEYAKSRGSLAFPFGSLGLSQYGYPFLVRIASLGGVFLLSFLIVLANASLALWLSRHLPSRKGEAGEEPGRGGQRGRGGLELILASLLLLAASLAAQLVPGAWHQGAETGRGPGGATAAARAPESIRIALIQHGHGKQRKAGEYRSAFEDLKALTEEALAGKPDLVIWPESAIVPSINWHLAMREDRELYDLAREVDGYAADLPCPLLFGNDLAEARPGADPAYRRIDRNAAILRHGASTQAYAKTRLVPFAEEVPPALVDTRIGNYALELSSGGWARGKGPVILDLGSAGAAGASGAGTSTLPRLSFGTPICFEDGFGDYCLGFARQGAAFLAVLTSDSWAHSASCEYQHLGQSVFRSAETGLPVVRAASTGITALILPDGRIAKELPPFARASLVVDLPLRGSSPTPYGRIGDRATLLAGLAALLALCLALAHDLLASRNASH
jgi:apolipoprotein N-acyltransferase